jgi:hypothetical protein
MESETLGYICIGIIVIMIIFSVINMYGGFKSDDDEDYPRHLGM